MVAYSFEVAFVNGFDPVDFGIDCFFSNSRLPLRFYDSHLANTVQQVIALEIHFDFYEVSALPFIDSFQVPIDIHIS